MNQVRNVLHIVDSAAATSSCCGLKEILSIQLVLRSQGALKVELVSTDHPTLLANAPPSCAIAEYFISRMHYRKEAEQRAVYQEVKQNYVVHSTSILAGPMKICTLDAYAKLSGPWSNHTTH
jgi:hypothetical protein